jgi:hypothetical protein
VYLLDTDVLIDIQREYAPALRWFATLTELPTVPGLVVMELIQDAQNARQVRQALKLVAPLPVVWPTAADCQRTLTDFIAYHLSHNLGLLDALLGGIRRLIRQETGEHAEGGVPDGHAGTLSCPLARGWRLATGIIGLARGLRHDEPQGLMIEPGPQIGAAQARELRELPDTGAALAQPEIEASALDERLAMGFICATWYGTGTHFPLIQKILQYVYAQGKGAGPERDVGTGHWIRGMLRGLLATEGIRTAMRHFGHQPLTGTQVQWGARTPHPHRCPAQGDGGRGPALSAQPVLPRS